MALIRAKRSEFSLTKLFSLWKTCATDSASAQRWDALSVTNDRRQVHITYTLRAGGTLIRVICA
jgi:uncharacterized DUF497 family protein